MPSFRFKKRFLVIPAVITLVAYYFWLPDSLFDQPYSTVLEDRTGQLLSASIARDGQWRFPQSTEVPEKFSKAIVAYEDKRFWDHPGVDILALGRALRENLSKGRIVSGGSTLTMQVIRLSQGNPSRTIFQKIKEIILSTRLELRYSKREILELYASHAPFGGNVVGIEAACWRYFGRGSREISWSEASLLAVLPNNPSLIHLARNRERLLEKRNTLLRKLSALGYLNDLDLQLALDEPVPMKPLPLPQQATHLLHRVSKEGFAQKIVRSTIDLGMQTLVEQILEEHGERLRSMKVFNASALILDVKTGETLVYAGNIKSGKDHQEDVDVIGSQRSTGSILKPFLYAALLDEGKLLPKTLVPDVPLLIGGYAPKNFSRQMDGSVSADKALIRSLNIPAVVELRDFRYEKFHRLLGDLGMTTLAPSPDRYGLSLVLGGAEGTLWDITGMYASMARTLVNYFERPGGNKYQSSDVHPPRYVKTSASDSVKISEASGVLSASSIWFTFETLKELYRPGEETGWRHFSSSKPVAWKTGTSFGFRDGWAVGVSPRYAVGVWVGNADGEGRPGLTGTEAAAPLMFNIFSFLPGATWFDKPTSELREVSICAQSGQRASTNCVDTIMSDVPFTGLGTESCKYCVLVHLSENGKYRIHRDCFTGKIKDANWFVLPPVQEYYFKKRNVGYRRLPPYQPGCADPSAIASLDIIYPKVNSKIFLPVQLDGKAGSTIFEAAHRNSEAILHWHLDGQFVGSTRKTHHIVLSPEVGRHVLTLVDGSGETLERSFEVISGR